MYALNPSGLGLSGQLCRAVVDPTTAAEICYTGTIEVTKCVLDNDVIVKQLLIPKDVDMPEGLFPVSVACGPNVVLVLARDRANQSFVLSAGAYGKGQKLTVCALLRTERMTSRSWSPSKCPRTIYMPPIEIRTFKHPRKCSKKASK